MNTEAIKNMLDGIFTTVKKDNGEVQICFQDHAMKPESGLYPIYQAISKAQQDSGLTFDFSYEVAKKAVDILAEAELWEDLTPAIDSAVPIYNGELMTIYANDWNAVDEAVEELGGGDSVKNAQAGWYMAIENMVHAIKENLSELQS
jgi:hypothetical protein